jgi:dipeptidyl-peptidase-4
MPSIARVLFTFLSLQIILSAQSKELTFEDLFTKREFYGRGLSGIQWMPQGDKFTFLKMDPASASFNIIQHDVKSGEESVLISGQDLKLEAEDEPFRIQNYKWSLDSRYIMFTGVLPARTLKSGGNLYLYDLKEKRFFIAAESSEEQVNAAISPDSKKIGFVRGNNLFMVDIETNEEKQLTFDGNENILNGVFDWVYEEEFSIIMGWEWAPDSKTIAYWRMDQSKVPDLYIAKWDSLYMEPRKMKYPKPGAANSLVKIGVVDISSAKTIWMDTGEEEDIYIPRMKFTHDPYILSFQRLNRLQNKLELMFADIRTGKSRVVITETSEIWIDVYDDIRFLDNGEEFIWSSTRDGYQHLYLYEINGTMVRQLTKGDWELNYVMGINENEGSVFFTANERGTIYSDLYSVNFDGTGLKRITDEPGTHFVTISPDGKYFIDKYSTANSPTITSLKSTSGGKLRDLVVPDVKFIKEYDFVPVEFITFTTSDGVELNASIMKPPDFDSSKKYPVLFDVYGGPGSQAVLDIWGSFGYLLNQLLVGKGYIIFCVDNRGTGNRGTAFRHIVYKDLGKWEVNDMVEGAKYLISQGYADPGRIGIMGSSYGGYTAAISLMNAPEYFKAAVAVATVSDWGYYDNIYTERYMQTPELNPDGYERSSLIANAEKLKGKLLLVHGTADDNVHFQNSVKLAEKLIDLNKDFDILLYPEQGHGIHGKASRHYCREMIEFLDENLKGSAEDQVTKK